MVFVIKYFHLFWEVEKTNKHNFIKQEKTNKPKTPSYFPVAKVLIIFLFLPLEESG